MLFVYWFEDHPQYSSRVGEIREKMTLRNDTLCTSVLTLGEILTGAYKQGGHAVATQVKELFHSSTIELLPFTSGTADEYARIRAQNRVTPADAIHLASASVARVNLFLTNDRGLQRLVVPGVDFIAGLDVNLF
jgi:predicted nucleic acid-binding protein